jgi:hypothetical protein
MKDLIPIALPGFSGGATQARLGTPVTVYKILNRLVFFRLGSIFATILNA